jgi:multiple sugar transport system ATP-binding protein
MARLVLENLTKDFGKTRAIDNLSLDIEDGEFIVMLGPSGAGKTTTLKLIAGVETPTSGKIFIGNKLVNAIEPHKRNVAMAFESYALYPHYNVKQNLAYPLRAPGRNIPQAEIERRVNAVAEMLNIHMLLDRLPRMLSNGQKQRVALGRAMVREPEVLLLDEPISHLDAKLRHRMRTEFKALESAIQVTTVYVTHDYLEALSLGDRLVVIEHGKVQQVGKPSEVFDNPANIFVSQILGHPQINVIHCEVQGQESRVQFVSKDGAIRIDAPAPVGEQVARHNLNEVMLGIRPLYMRVADGHNDGHNIFDASVYVYERLGTKGVLTVNTSQNKLDIITPIEMDFHIDQPVQIAVEQDNILVFDPKTTQNIMTN